jgi:ATP-dependent exoDNAse (exonuclease V) beta subunit
LLKYILKFEDVENAYAQFGTLAHSILEEWASGRLNAEDMHKEWTERHDKEVTAEYAPFPKNFRQSSYKKGLEYFQKFSGFGDEKAIVSTEQEYYTTIGGCQFRGIIDLVLRDKNTERLAIIDHKSKSLASFNKDTSIIRQLYCYSKLIKDAYNEYPSELFFNLFKEGGVLIEEPFSMEKYMETINWVETNIVNISMETEWEPRYQPMFCDYICGVRGKCEKALSML